MYLQIWYTKYDTKFNKKQIYGKNLYISLITHSLLCSLLLVCIICIQLLHAVGRRPHPTSMDMVHRVTPWISFMWLESSDSHYDFKSAFSLVGRAGSVVLVGNMWRRSFCHHIQGSPHRNVLPRDDSRIATRPGEGTHSMKVITYAAPFRPLFSGLWKMCIVSTPIFEQKGGKCISTTIFCQNFAKCIASTSPFWPLVTFRVNGRCPSETQPRPPGYKTSDGLKQLC